MFKLFIRNKVVEILNIGIIVIKALAVLIIGMLLYAVASELVGLIIHQTVNLVSSDAGNWLLEIFRDRSGDVKSYTYTYWWRVGSLGMISINAVAFACLIIILATRWIRDNIMLAKSGVRVKLKFKNDWVK